MRKQLTLIVFIFSTFVFSQNLKTSGKIIVDDPWMPGRNGGPYHSIIRIIKNDREELKEFKGPEHLFFFEVELSIQTILKQKQNPRKNYGRRKVDPKQKIKKR